MPHSLPVSRSTPVVAPRPFLKAISFIFLGLSLLSLTGCSTVVNGRRQALTVNSNPPGAAFNVDGVTGVTPGTVNVERARPNHTVAISKPGYQPTQITVGRKLSPWLAGNVLVGGLIGLVVDLGTGGAYALQSDQVQATLQPVYGASSESPTSQGSAVVDSSHSVQRIETSDAPNKWSR
jgi:hypothetical protein